MILLSPWNYPWYELCVTNLWNCILEDVGSLAKFTITFWSFNINFILVSCVLDTSCWSHYLQTRDHSVTSVLSGSDVEKLIWTWELNKNQPDSDLLLKVFTTELSSLLSDSSTKHVPSYTFILLGFFSDFNKVVQSMKFFFNFWRHSSFMILDFKVNKQRPDLDYESITFFWLVQLIKYLFLIGPWKKCLLLIGPWIKYLFLIGKWPMYF